MPRTIEIAENGLYLVIAIEDGGDVLLLHCGASPFDPATVLDGARSSFRLLELQATGEDRGAYHGRTHNATFPGLRLRYAAHRDSRTAAGRKLEVELRDPPTGLVAVSHLQCFDGIPVVRCWTELRNEGTATLGLEYVSSFALTGLAKEGLLGRDEKMRVMIPYNGWKSELQWRASTLPELGLAHLAARSSRRIACSNTGSWSTAEHLPMGYLENAETGCALAWQIEHNGSWHWELIEQADHLALLVSGPTELDHSWWKRLAPGESFVTVPVAIAAATGPGPAFDAAIGALTRYRRAIRRPNQDNRALPIIFNDYMNCLWGDPTTAKLLPLIDAAAEVGCEYFCIDCGWYSDGAWWDGVGAWEPSAKRFPGGIREVIERIRARGMVPGLWLELEVMGVKSPKLADASDDWFFMRHGRRVKDRSRYQLDFRNPAVVAHADAVLARLVDDWGVGYIKLDYNINAGLGTELAADSPGDGLLQHNRAYLAWLDRVFARWPGLVIENCSSGGMRIDYAMLARHSIQSTSDQENYLNYAPIAAASPSALTPEQSAIWSYPLREGEGDEEEVVFNMVNALLLRVHQSGHLAELGARRRALVKEALDLYKRIRADIPEALPFWPLGLPRREDGWVAFGLRRGDRGYLAVWRVGAPQPRVALPLPWLAGAPATARCIYPAGSDASCAWQAAAGALSVALPEDRTARLFEIGPAPR
jgi:alpha-galactosidase